MQEIITFKSLKEAREFHGMTQEQLAIAMGTKQSVISRVEKLIDSDQYYKVSLTFYDRAAKAMNGWVEPPKFGDLKTD